MVDWLTPEQRSRNMAAIRSVRTKPEERLALLLAAMLPRRRVVQHAALPGKPDFYLPGLKLAVFMDGCFWHGCPKHGRIPVDNREYWEPKLARNRERDHTAVVALHRQGVSTVRIWEHELRHDVGAARRKLTRGLIRAGGRGTR
jgi:DNA mismatch endonuclease, patch repair protein